MVFLGDEVLGNTTMTKKLAACQREDAMSRERVTLFDTTLRDGAQTTGVDFSLDDKKQIAGLLDALGVDYVEGGYPGANPLDTEFFSKKRDEESAFRRFRHDPARRAAPPPTIRA